MLRTSPDQYEMTQTTGQSHDMYFIFWSIRPHTPAVHALLIKEHIWEFDHKIGALRNKKRSRKQAQRNGNDQLRLKADEYSNHLMFENEVFILV